MTHFGTLPKSYLFNLNEVSGHHRHYGQQIKWKRLDDDQKRP